MLAVSNPFTGEMNLKLNEEEIQLIIDAVGHYKGVCLTSYGKRSSNRCDDMVFEIQAEIDLARLKIRNR